MVRHSEVRLEKELELLQETIQSQKIENSRMSFRIHQLEEIISQKEEDLQAQGALIEDFDLLRVISQSGLLRTLKIQDSELESLLKKLLSSLIFLKTDGLPSDPPKKTPVKKAVTRKV